jgi:predicted DNA-binding transcriptional regulator AlpA
MQHKNVSMRLIRFPELNKMLGGISRRTLYRWENDGLFPRRVKLAIAAWRYEDICEWFKMKI